MCFVDGCLVSVSLFFSQVSEPVLGVMCVHAPHEKTGKNEEDFFFQETKTFLVQL